MDEDARRQKFQELLAFIEETANKVKDWPEWEKQLLGLKKLGGK